MKRNALCIAAFLTTALAQASTAQETASPIDVRSMGAKGDGVADDTKAVQRAIDTCSDADGGRVLFPAGCYLCGSIRLRSNVELDLAENARVIGTENLE